MQQRPKSPSKSDPRFGRFSITIPVEKGANRKTETLPRPGPAGVESENALNATQSNLDICVYYIRFFYTFSQGIIFFCERSENSPASGPASNSISCVSLESGQCPKAHGTDCCRSMGTFEGESERDLRDDIIHLSSM